jgi:hypothetical protein
MELPMWGYDHLIVKAWQGNPQICCIWPFHMRNYAEVALKDISEALFSHQRLGTFSPVLLQKITAATDATVIVPPGNHAIVLRLPTAKIPGLVRFRRLLDSQDYTLLPLPSNAADDVAAYIQQTPIPAEQALDDDSGEEGAETKTFIRMDPRTGDIDWPDPMPDVHRAAKRLLKGPNHAGQWGITSGLLNHDDDIAEITLMNTATFDHILDYMLRNFIRNVFGIGYFHRLSKRQQQYLHGMKPSPLPKDITRSLRKLALGPGFVCDVKNLKISRTGVRLRCWRGPSQYFGLLGENLHEIDSYHPLTYATATGEWHLGDIVSEPFSEKRRKKIQWMSYDEG